jgi:hypothetical protein
MKTLLPQGFTRSLPSFTTCGYLPSSRQNSLNLATRHPQGCPGNLRSSLREEDAGKSRSAIVANDQLGVNAPAAGRACCPGLAKIRAVSSARRKRSVWIGSASSQLALDA